jgi:hypothetical protein
LYHDIAPFFTTAFSLTWTLVTLLSFSQRRYGHFDRIVVIEAELLPVLNTLKERNLQDALKNGRSAGNGAWGLLPV